MIKNLTLQNFKSHQNTVIDINNLTVLSGPNAVGKSSIVHALLLIREAYLSNSDFNYLNLRTKPIDVGTAKDVIYQFADSNEVCVEIVTDTNKLNFNFEIENSSLTKTLIPKKKTDNFVYNKEELSKENLFNKDFQYISAARLGPQPYYPKDDVVVEIQNQLSVDEGKAEHFVHFLYYNKDKVVLQSLLNNSIDSNDLFYQTTAWEREISSGVNIIIEDLGTLGYDLKYRFDTDSSDGKTDNFKASNVGYGLTYVMPILVAILSAPIGSMLFIENPEAHIHPNGQGKLAELICRAAQAGVQIMLETHSDHIINGILVQMKRFKEEEIGISQENVSIYFFSRDESNHSAIVSPVEIADSGAIKYPPKGFFDQFSIDRKYLMGF